MGKINFKDTKLDGVKIVLPFFFEDNRGYFIKAYEKNIFTKNGVETDVVEIFESYSRPNVIRGLHFQIGETAQSKLVRALRGEIFDVCVDIRPDSPTFGQWVGEYLSEYNHKALFMNKGFAHGFMAVNRGGGQGTLVSYTCSGAFNAESESGIIYNDPDINILWPINDINDVIQSERDAHLPSFKDYCKRSKDGGLQDEEQGKI